MKATRADAAQLLLEGSVALAEVEHAGFRIDVEYLDRKIVETKEQARGMEAALKADETFKIWKREFGANADLGSDAQLAKIVYEVLKYPCRIRTKKNKRGSTSTEAFKGIDLPFVHQWLDWQQVRDKKLSTYLMGIKREVVNGYLHPNYNLNFVWTYRSSASDPNSQNFPARDQEFARLVRTAFIPRDDHELLENDFKAAEVCVDGNTLIETIEGAVPIKKLVENLKTAPNGIHVYGYDHEKGRLAVGRVLDGGRTKKKAAVWKVILDNGESVIATSTHKFMRRNGDYVELKELKPGDSLMPFYKTTKVSKWKTVYTKVYLNNGKSILAHNLIALDIFGVDIGRSNQVVHHWDHNGTNNGLGNIEVMPRSEHMSIHVQDSWADNKRDLKVQKSNAHTAKMSKAWMEKWNAMTEKEKEEFKQRIRDGFNRNGGPLTGERNGMYGKRHSEETRKNISEKKKGVPRTTEIWNVGQTKETHPSLMASSIKQKGRPAHNKGKKGKPLSEEAKKHLSNFWKGRVFSEEHKKKLSIARKRAWDRKRLSAEEYEETYNHKVVSIEYAGCRDVYNINVEGFHNYAIGAGIIIKNCSSPCYHFDPNWINYIIDTSKDMHRDAAKRLLCIPDDMDKSWWKDKEAGGYLRQTAKGDWVFAEMYGSYYVQCAERIWEKLKDKPNLKINGVQWQQHLADNGIHERGDCIKDSREPPRNGTFEKHCKEFEDWYWKVQYPVYSKWKRDWFDAYLKCGYIDMLTGFRCEGIFGRNQILDAPIQGTAFHWLLYVMIELVKWIRKYKLKSRVVGQIHDSLISDVHIKEKDDYLAKVKELVTVGLKRRWDWICVPVTIEAEIAPLNWFAKEQIPL